ncbi:MAG: DNA polymerase/3'-5' exonuclease PolX [Planctomycetota bacterium]
MDKSDIVKVFEEMRAILELRGENVFRIRAFENGARALEDWEGDLEEMVESGGLTSIHGIGKGLATIITDLIQKGRSEDYEEMRASIPITLLELLRIPGVGSKKARVLYEKLGITSLAELEEACREQRLRTLRGFAAKSESEILSRIERLKRYQKRHVLPLAEQVAKRFLERLRGAPGVVRLAVAGSLRRCMETIGDLDILVATTDVPAAREVFLAEPSIIERVAQGEQKCRVMVQEEVEVDLRAVEPHCFAAALHYFTGSKQHNMRMRAVARERGWKLNEYGLWNEQGALLPCPEEEDIFRHLGFAYLPPELREDQGEVEQAAQLSEWPLLVEESQLKGALHCHTVASDGQATLREMAEGAQARGWEYLGIADHSRSSVQAGGLSVERLRAQRQEIETLNQELRGFTLLHGVECDILPDGSLDFPEDVLAELDYVVVSVHSSLTLSRREQTARIEKALRHPCTSIWGHPSARLLLKREPLALDMDYLLRVAREEGVVVEINGQPRRLDLDWRWGPRVRELGITTAINPDAHRVEGLDHVRYGIGVARKAGLEPQQVVNTLPLQQLKTRLKERTLK